MRPTTNCQGLPREATTRRVSATGAGRRSSARAGDAGPRSSAPARAGELNVGPKEPEPAFEEEDLAIDRREQHPQPLLRRGSFEERLAARRFDLDDPGKQVREDGRIVGD